MSAAGAGAWAIGLVAPVAAAEPSTAPVIAPVPDWVKPLPDPKLSEPKDPAAARLVSEDLQVKLGDDGSVQTYDHRWVQVLTEEGLAVGSLQLSWNPDTDVLFIHHLRIHRGQTTIDVLGAGQTFTVLRRETISSGPCWTEP